MANNQKHGSAFFSIVGNEHFRYVNQTTHKQEAADNEITYRIGEIDPITVTSLYPVNEQRFDIIPWAYKPATQKQIESGNYRNVTKNGVVYTLATDNDGNTRPLVLTGRDIVRLVADAMADAATYIVREHDMVGLHVTYIPQTDWSVTTGSVRKGASNNRKNRHGRNDNATAKAAKAARATARAAARKGTSK